MNAAIRRIARAPYFQETEESREDLTRRRRQTLVDNAYGAMMALLAVASIVVLRVVLSF